MKSVALLCAAVAATAVFGAGPAAATLANRTFVSGQGQDTNPCTLADPCRSFAGALAQTNPGGEITVLDSAGYGAVTIDRAVSIVNPGGVEAGITPAAGSDAITINAPAGAAVSLRGLTIEGAAIGNHGVSFNTGARLEIIGSVIRDFIGGGINLHTASGNVSLMMSNTIVSDNLVSGSLDAFGVLLSASSGAQVIATIDHCNFDNNDIGFEAAVSSSTGGIVQALLTDSHVDNNVVDGIVLQGGQVQVRNTTVNQTPTAIILEGNNSAIWLSQVTETTVPALGSVTGIIFAGGGNTALSDGTNRLAPFGTGVTLGTWATQ